MDTLFTEKYKKLHDLWYDWEFSIEWLLDKLPDHLSEPFIDFKFTYRLVIEKRVLNSYDVMYINSKREPHIIQWIWPWFYWVWHNLLYTLADMWIWAKENNYIYNSTTLTN
jgi:hypothetical protein